MNQAQLDRIELAIQHIERMVRTLVCAAHIKDQGDVDEMAAELDRAASDLSKTVKGNPLPK